MVQVWQGVRGADVVVADITGRNSNVMYELGLGIALGKEAIIVTQEQQLPFDLRHWRTVKYEPDRRDDL
jgi:nucleoside 2-deoxyribosyltransferase